MDLSLLSVGTMLFTFFWLIVLKGFKYNLNQLKPPFFRPRNQFALEKQIKAALWNEYVYIIKNIMPMNGYNNKKTYLSN